MVVLAFSRNSEALEVDLIDGVVAAAIWGERSSPQPRSG